MMPIQERYIAGDEILEGGRLTISLQNRALRYGDGVFETILVRNGQAIALQMHLRRMRDGVRALDFGMGAWNFEAAATLLVEKLLKGQDASATGRMRLTAYRQDGGAFLPTADGYQLIGEIIPLPADPWELQAPKRLIPYPGPAHSPLSAFKTLNALPYVLAAKFAAAHGYDDALLHTAKLEAQELSAANCFVVIDGRLRTPSEKSGCLPGTMRNRLVAAAKSLGIAQKQVPIPLHAFNQATEAFSTNAIQGLQPIGEIQGLHYRPEAFPVMMALREALQQTIAGN